MAQLKADPSRTKTERNAFMRGVKRRMKRLADAVTTLIVKDDAFGIEDSATRTKSLIPKASRDLGSQNRRQYAFRTDPEKIRQFQEWLQQQIDAGILEVVGGVKGKPWTAQYVESAWRKGMMRAYTDVHKQDLTKRLDWWRGTKEQWLRSAFLQPILMDKVQMLATRAFENMKGVTEVMKTQMSRILADGLIAGYNPRKIAKQMTDSIVSLTRKRALVIARTEIIYAHAEGQLDGYTQLGISEVQAEVEWLTAGDDRVCPDCVGMEGQVFTVKEAHGMIPLHPNCRCAWMPVVVGVRK